MTRDQTQAVLADALNEKYEILRWIGGGGMAEVFLARHRIHGALFAVKVLSTDLAEDERIVARFVQEARTAATLAGHANIVPIFDIGAQNGLYFLIMQYVEGEDLAKYLKRNQRLAPQDAAHVACQVADALVWASAKGVVHRDLKPSNLYLDQNGRIMVLDFGIAKAADVPSVLTAATERLGTVYYMSPEQIMGRPCDSRSDLYSLGVVFFEMLTGRKLFEADNSRAIEIAHVQTPAPDLREADPSMPGELAYIVGHLLEKSPEDRYQSPSELVEHLNQLGASSNPLMLRPNVTPIIPAVEQGAPPHQPTPVSTPRPETNRPGLATLTPSANSIPSGQMSATPAPISSPPAQKTQDTKLIWGGIAVFSVLIAAAALYLFFTRHPGASKGPPAQTETHGAAPPAANADLKLDKLGGRMKLVPAGNFIFGNDTDPTSPNGKETDNLPAFYIDETEVSNAAYKAFCDQMKHAPPASATFNEKPDFPVTNVSFEDAAAFANWIGKRLPSEKEWEKAARGTDGRIYPWGNDPWIDPPVDIEPVLSNPERLSPFGAYNMAGNVMEWTTSHYPAGPAEIADMTKLLGTPEFSRNWKVIKGGYFGRDKLAVKFFRTYQRRGFPEDSRVSPVIGFRCIVDAP
ncbi:MAG TPA: SUMF1/EgtB/PvdO family nonheme iron enzyme [Bryobacteraceae bacterium]|nr:SUMF1/EgtB/PvdO family nonheme iron enzyme [Bryobacteraceae bacterium]